jgi:hypothetical protein
VIVQPISISVNPNDQNPFAPIVKIIDQSGLSSPYTSGVTDFDTYTATTTHEQEFPLFSSPINFGQGGGAGNINTPSGVSFTFDLGSVLTLDALSYWLSDTGTSGVIDQDVKDFQLFAGTDDTGTLLGTYSATQGDFDGLSNAQIFTFSPTSTQFITLKVQSVFFQGNDPSIVEPIIGEIAFREAQEPPATPEPGTILGLVTVGALGALSRQRKG